MKIIEGTHKNKKIEIENEIFEKHRQIEDKKMGLKDEKNGVDKVNEYLNNFFGHNILSLEAIESEKKVRFEVIRDGKKAYHLSGGECSLIAFCYFVAKLNDIETQGSKPIIWIDDPISSLDSNHIFFIYSILNAEIVSNKIYEQLFISTHNLDFLKYLKRLPGAHNDIKKKDSKKIYQYFVVQRVDKNSSIRIMPNYLRDFVTEFNYLFHEIYNCSKIQQIDDSNYNIFYNLGNVARKFLELYLYYKYPDSKNEDEKLVKFFGNEKIPALLTDRINNEYSHLCAIFERGATTVEVPEMNSTAKLIIERIKKIDIEQYNSLMNSIGATP